MKLPATIKIYLVFHVSLLEPYCIRLGEEPRNPSPKLIEGEEEYVVDKVLDYRLFYSKKEYLVR